MADARRVRLLEWLKEATRQRSFELADEGDWGYAHWVSWEAYKHYSRLLDKELGYAETGT